MLIFMFAAVLAVAWGLFGKPHVAAAAILMLEMGDARAARVRLPFGKHKIRFKPTIRSDSSQSMEENHGMDQSQ